MQLMRFPMGDGVRRNGCTAKPCEYKRLFGKAFSRSEFLDTTLKTCLTDEDSVCGSLICRNQGGRQRRNVGNGISVSLLAPLQLFGQRPRQGTKFCRMGRNSIRPSVHPSIHPSAPLWLAHRSCWLALRPCWLAL